MWLVCGETNKFVNSVNHKQALLYGARQCSRLWDKQINNNNNSNSSYIRMNVKIVFALEFARVDFQLSAANAAYVQCQQFSCNAAYGGDFKEFVLMARGRRILSTVKCTSCPTV